MLRLLISYFFLTLIKLVLEPSNSHIIKFILFKSPNVVNGVLTASLVITNLNFY